MAPRNSSGRGRKRAVRPETVSEEEEESQMIQREEQDTEGNENVVNDVAMEEEGQGQEQQEEEEEVTSGNRNRIRGPSSALSSFLREKGIKVPGKSVWERRRNVDNNSGESSQTQINENTNEGVDDEIIEPNDTENVMVAVKVNNKNKKKKRDYSDDSDDDFYGPNGYLEVQGGRKGKKNVNRLPLENFDFGSIRFCDRCKRKYMITEERQQFCDACSSLREAAGIKSSSNGTSNRKKILDKTNRKRRDLYILDAKDSYGSVLPLTVMAMQVIVNCIDDVESFGIIPPRIQIQLARIISKWRKLDSKSVKLFISNNETQVNLFDCTYLSENDLLNLVQSIPNVTQLHLGLCGRMTDMVIDHMGKYCTHINDLTLEGPFLPTEEAFNNLLGSLKLNKLSLQYAANLNSDAIVKLLETSKDTLEYLRIDQCLSIGDKGVRLLGEFDNLKTLILTDLGLSVSEESLASTIESIGDNLTELQLNYFPHLSDHVLNDIIAAKCTNLQHLALGYCGEESFTTEGLTLFFKEKWNPNISDKLRFLSLDLTRNHQLKDDFLIVFLERYGYGIQNLNLNGLDLLTNESLMILAKSCPNLITLDVSWVRAVTDVFLIDLFNTSKNLESINIYGCNFLSEDVVNNDWINGNERKIKIVGNEYI